MDRKQSPGTKRTFVWLVVAVHGPDGPDMDTFTLLVQACGQRPAASSELAELIKCWYYVFHERTFL